MLVASKSRVGPTLLGDIMDVVVDVERVEVAPTSSSGNHSLY